MRGQKHTFRIRKFLPIFAVVGILAVVGGVFAFNQDSAFFNNQFGIASYESEFIETFESPADWETCQEVPKTVVTKNNSTGNFKVRLSYEEYWRNAADDANLPLVKDGETLALINFQNENDWTRHGNWYYYNYEVEPGDSTNSLFKSVTLNCDANLAKYNVCVDTPTGKECTQPENEYEAATYHLNIKVQTTSGEFPHDEQYHVTLNPNGGTYEGSTDIYDAYLQYGTVIDLDSVTYPEHEIVDWTLNGTESYTDSTITITDDTDLVANWQTSIFHTVTVDPNGGSLDGETQPISTRVRKGDSYTLTSTEPTMAGHLFTGWTVNGQPLANYTFAVMDDVTITANWGPIIAQNTRTSKLYTSLTNAEAEAQSGDTIKLVNNDEEHFTNTKNITLDLNDFVVSGSVTNNGTMTLLNGEIRNEDGVAFTNNGTLTMGINDHIDENTANVVSDYVRLIGTTTGLDQNGTFNYYDGYIEGEVALEGGYNDSPSYRNTYDGKIVYYFPLVDSCKNQETCQHAELESSDLAHSKTIVGGDIYYYNIQENINASMRTGYDIYIVRDDFATGYGINVPTDADIVIDLDGHSFTMTDAITVDGKLTVRDSKTTVTRGATINYAGEMFTPQTTVNNGTLVMNNSRITGTSGNDTIIGRGALTMRGARLGATTGYVIQPLSGVTYDLDDDSYFYSTSASKAAVYITSGKISDFAWNAGNIYGTDTAVYVYTDSAVSTTPVSINISGGTIRSSRIGIETKSNTGHGHSAVDKTVSFTGGSIILNEAKSYSYGIHTDSQTNLIISANNGSTPTINITGGSNNVYGVYTENGSNKEITLNGASINVSSNSSNIYGIITGYASINNSNITVDGSSNAYGVYANDTTIKNSEISVNVTRFYSCNNPSSTYDKRYIYGLRAQGNVIIEDTDVTVTSAANNACYTGYGFYSYGPNTNNKILTGTDIQVRGFGAVNYGAYASSNGLVIAGGKIYSDNYGLYVYDNTVAVIGSNDGNIDKDSPEIIGKDYALYGSDTGYVKYYDGTLRGGVEAYKDGIISAIPDGTSFHKEESAEYAENCWLVPASNYLSVNGVGYNSLQLAYDAITEDSGTIYVTDDVTIEAVLPSSPANKTITFDLNGHNLIYTQPLINGGTMIIINGDPEKEGKLSNYTESVSTIINRGNLTVNSGSIFGTYRAVDNQNGNFNLNGGIIEGTDTAVYVYTDSAVSTTPVSINISGGTIRSSRIGIETKSNAYHGHSAVDKTVSFTGGSIILNEAKSNSYGIHTDSQTNLIISANNGSTPTINITGGSNNVYGVYTENGSNKEITLNGASINVSSNSSNIYGIITGYASINNSNITVDGSSNAYGVYANDTTIKNSEISVNVTRFYSCNNPSSTYDKRYIYGLRAQGNVIIEDTDVTVTSAANNACYTGYGFYSYGPNTNNKILTGTDIQVRGFGAVNYGAYASSNGLVIAGGKIYSDNYGLYVYDNTVAVIGSNDGNIDKDSPEIIGKDYALYGSDTGYVKYYDGTLRGGVEAYRDGLVKQFADNSMLHVEQQTIDSTEYETRWLVNEDYVAKIGEDRKFKQLSAAIAAAEEDDEIELLMDNYITSAITIPAEKDFSIKTNGYRIILSNPITNNGKVVINNNATTNIPDIAYRSSDYAIINNTNAELTLKNIKLDANYGIENKGALALDNISSTASKTAIKNTGNITTQNSVSLSGADYAIYNDGGNANMTSAAFGEKYIYNYSGSLTIANSTASKIDSSTDYIVNKGSLIISNSSISSVINSFSDVSSNTTRAIYNTGTLTLSNNTTINHSTNTTGGSYSRFDSIYNDGGIVYALSATIIADNTNISDTYSSYDTAAVYSPTGSFTIESGSISATAKGKTYGIYTDTGTITIGVPEPEDSGHHGDADADVKINNPNIQAISTATNNSYKLGVGVKNNGSNGKVYYYDGRVAGSTAAMPEEPTKTEFHYEVCREMDTSVTPNMEFTRLFWVREGGQSTCTNE